MTIFLVIIFSLIFGSFATCISHRLSNGEKFAFVRSKCIICEAKLAPKNLVPIFSWIFQKGKCDKCKQKISLFYPLTELFFLLSFLTIFFFNHQHFDKNFILLCLIFTVLAIISIIDIKKYFIPDILQMILLILCLFFVVNQIGFESIGNRIFSGVAFLAFGFFLHILFLNMSNVEAIGIDDLKILFTIGFAIGLSKFVFFTFFTGIFGIIFGLFWKKIKKDETFPFAPALAASMFICLMIGNLSITNILKL